MTLEHVQTPASRDTGFFRNGLALAFICVVAALLPALFIAYALTPPIKCGGDNGGGRAWAFMIGMTPIVCDLAWWMYYPWAWWFLAPHTVVGACAVAIGILICQVLPDDEEHYGYS